MDLALPGVNVVVKGTTNGTVSDANGSYSISAPATGTLVFTFIGLTTQEVPINNRTTVDVLMAQDVQQLSEVVVTALNIPREKASLGYATQQVKGDAVTQPRIKTSSTPFPEKLPAFKSEETTTSVVQPMLLSGVINQ